MTRRSLGDWAPNRFSAHWRSRVGLLGTTGLPVELHSRGDNMKILALVASPRKGSNTDILVDQILKGCKESGHSGEKLYLYHYRISPCIDCRNCKKGEYVCTLKDSMQQIYPKMEEADLIIFGTPNYWFGPTAKMKLLVDRMRPFAANKKMKGKRWVLVTHCSRWGKSMWASCSDVPNVV